MVTRDDITQFIQDSLGKDILNKASVKDEAANGIQIEGLTEVSKVAYGVTLSETFLKQAIDQNAQYLFFHHGLDPRTYLARLPRYLQNELRLIFEHRLTIAGFHYTLDAHPVLGNNAQIIHKLGANIKETLYEDWGFTATFTAPKSLAELKTTCEQIFQHPVLSFESGPQSISTIGVVSGAGKPYALHLQEFIDKGVQLYISGETSESVPHKLIESGINYFVCGHYATEVFGVQALGSAIKQRYGDQLEVEFIDIPSDL